MPAIGRKIGWAYNQIGFLTFDVPIWEAMDGKRNESYHTWDMIGIILDLEKGTLGFMKNGKELGVAFSKGLRGKEVFPGVCLCSGEEQVTFVTSRTYVWKRWSSFESILNHQNKNDHNGLLLQQKMAMENNNNPE